MKSVLINIDVPDLKAATKFYSEAFGLRTGRKFGDSVVEMLGLPAAIYLLKKPVGSKPFRDADSVRDYKRHWTPVHLDIVVDSIEDTIVSASKAGAKIEEDVRTEAWGKIAICSDPFGNGFCLIEFLGRGYDEIAD